MHQFKDKSGKVWQIAVTIGSAMAVKAALQIDLLQPEEGSPPLLTRLATDELLLGSVICELLRPQFEANKTTEAEVYAGFDGETLLAAQEAFFGDLKDFFQARGRLERATAVRRQGDLLAAGIKYAAGHLEEIAKAKLREIEKMTTDGFSSGALPG